jgi:hypothetical protein
MNRIYLRFILICLFIATSATIAKSSDHSEINNVAKRFFYLISQEDYMGASKLFHYPPNYTQEEIKKDIEAVSKFLEAMGTSFGKLSGPVPYTGSNRIMSLQIGGGDIPYWKDHPDYLSKLYEVSFSKYGTGYVTLSLCNLTNNWEIREAKYGLDASLKNSVMLLQEAASHVQLLFQSK